MAAFGEPAIVILMTFNDPFPSFIQVCNYNPVCKTLHKRKCKDVPKENCGYVKECQQIPYEKCETHYNKDCKKVMGDLTRATGKWELMCAILFHISGARQDLQPFP